MKGRVLLALRPSVPCTSHRFPYPDTLPECPGIDIMPEAEEIKKRAATLPHIAVPAGATRPRWPIDAKGGMRVLAISMMVSKGTAAQATPVELHIATNHGVGVLCVTPCPDTEQSGGCRGGVSFFC